MASDDRPIVMKVGGSLFDLPELGKRLRAWLDQLDTRRVLLVPGGGPAADAVRLFDRVQHLGEEAAHWCALHAMNVNANMLSWILPDSWLFADHDDSSFQQAEVYKTKTAIIAPYEFARRDERSPTHLPHGWEVSSDSIAAQVANVFRAHKLILLKSVTIPPGMTWAEASQRGYVDRYFPTALAKAADLEVEAVNFRQWQPPT